MTRNDDLSYASIEDLAPRIRSGDLSPVELASAALERIRALDGRLNSFLLTFADEALETAHALEREIADGRRRGPLHGIPIGLKDLIDFAGKPTTGGSIFLKDNIAASDATVTRRLKDAGAVIMGKLNLVEFALGAHGLNPHYGPARNPWNLDRITCGSSSGSAAAVAAGLLVGALGSDTGGSIRMPAAACGIAGLKPTYGRVSRAGVLDLAWSLDHVGPMARRVSDCAYIMNAIAGHDSRDPASSLEPVPDFTSGLGRGLDGIRIGVPEQYFFENIDAEIEAAVRTAIALMERHGASATRVDMPWVSYGRAINTAIMRPEAASVHERWLKERRSEYGTEVLSRLESGLAVRALDYIRAQRARRWFNAQMAEAMRDVDVLATPTMPAQTPTIADCTPPPGENEGRAGGNLAIFTGVFDATGAPSLSLPCGFTRDGMPIGMMLSGKPFDEVTVLRVGDAYERLAGWRERRPPLPPSACDPPG